MKWRPDGLLRQPGFIRGLLVGLVLAAVVGALLWRAHDDGTTPAATSRHDARITVAEPQPSDGPTVVESSPDKSSQDSGAPAPVVVSGQPATKLPSAKKVSCPAATTTVGSAKELTAALSGAKPGDSIHLSDGTYTGEFVATASGTASAPIFLCGGSGAVLDGDSISGGYVFYLKGAQHWRLVGFSVRNGQKGVVADGTTGTVVQGLTVQQIGDEGIHLRTGSTGNAVLDNQVSHTGLRRDKFGEGVYVGSAESNWGTYTGGKPDRSDFNLVQGNTISDTGAESVDIKEGTTGGAVVDNTFDGSGMTGGDSWIDVKGNDWRIEGNVGRNTPKDGYQTHHIVDDWGSHNVFMNNKAEGNVPGVDFYVHDPDQTANVIECNNSGDGGAPTSNVTCSQ
jgi:nitrous oxidase accessory protein NosD